MTHESLSNWVPGVVFHTHSRLENLLVDTGERTREAEKHDGMVSTQALLWYAKRFYGDSNVLICDTDHPVHTLDRKGVERKGSFAADSLTRTIAIIDSGVIERSQILRQSEFGRNFLTGVEADILDKEGRLDVSNSVLSQLNIVIASLHYRYWKAINGRGPSSSEYIESVASTVLNPNVDAIGHPTRDLQKDHRATMKAEDWNPVFQAMRDTRVAYEINLYGYYAGNEELRLEREIIKRAASSGVQFLIGLDFHNFFEYQGAPVEGLVITQTEIEQVFDSHRGQSNFRLFRRLAKIKQELGRLGVNENNIINNSKEKFLFWLKDRNAKQ